MTAPHVEQLDLLYSQVEEDLRDSARRLLAEHCAPADLLARCESEEPYDRDLWRPLAGELGLAGLLVPESAGGSGASAREAGVFAEELGRALAPVPFLGSAALATACLLEPSDSPAATAMLGELSAGARVATVAVPLTTAPARAFPHAVRANADGALTGEVRGVVDLPGADAVLVPAVTDGEPAVFLVDLPTAGARCSTTTALDLTRRLGTLTLDGVLGTLLHTGDRAVAALQRALLTAAGLLSCEQLGLAQQCLDSTVDHVRTRYQFGRPVGSFQGLKHRLADLWAGVSTARAAARAAVDALATGQPGEHEVDLAVALAQAYCSDVAVLAAEEALQMHGGIGMTWEHPLHLYLGRAKSSQLALGTPEQHRGKVGELVDLPPAKPSV